MRLTRSWFATDHLHEGTALRPRGRAITNRGIEEQT